MSDLISINLTDDINIIKGVGAKTTALFSKLNIHNIGELIEHFPVNYDIYNLPISIKDAAEGQTVTIEAAIQTRLSIFKRGNKQIINCYVSDPSGRIKLYWFNQPYLKSKLILGKHFLFRGKITRNNAELVIDQPQIFTKDEYKEYLKTLKPIYHLTKGLGNTTVTKSIKAALEQLNGNIEFIPEKIIKENDLINYKKALLSIHFPECREDVLIAKKRLIFNEFLIFMLSIRALKEQKIRNQNNYYIEKSKEITSFIDNLPYKLTNAQNTVLNEIFNDMSSSNSMSRLLQGDVGSGKTIIACIAMLAAALKGYQSTLMAPTEVLAKQHYESFKAQLAPYNLNIILLTGSMTAAEKKRAYKQIAAHEADIIIGTHALIQSPVEYDKLALVITDEQHRFGVKQRESLENKSDHPHVLVMSATPIPRSLSLIMYGDLDISIINEMPANRKAIKNCVVDTNYRQTAYNFIKKQVYEGHQAYVICSMIEESEKSDLENVIEYTDIIRDGLADSSIVVEYLHGNMSAKEKNEIMEKYKDNKIQVLVSTTVIEVGVNVPNATVMMVENSERFGLAQLHQLRGRVGRGDAQAYCIFIKGTASKDAAERLNTLVKYNDGFKIAEEDMKLRGPGDLFGIRQSGDLQFKIGDIIDNSDILKLVSNIVNNMNFETSEEILEKYNKLFGKMIFDRINL